MILAKLAVVGIGVAVILFIALGARRNRNAEKGQGSK